MYLDMDCKLVKTVVPDGSAVSQLKSCVSVGYCLDMKVEVLLITDAFLNGKKIYHAGVLILCQYSHDQSPVLYCPQLDDKGKLKEIGKVLLSFNSHNNNHLFQFQFTMEKSLSTRHGLITKHHSYLSPSMEVIVLLKD